MVTADVYCIKFMSNCQDVLRKQEKQMKIRKTLDKENKIVYNKSVEEPVTVASYWVKKITAMLDAGGYLFLFPLLFKQEMIEKIKVAISNRSRQVMYSIATPPS